MAAKSEDDPITDDEYVLRRVFWDKFKTEKNPCISPSAFEPRTEGRDPDTEGISLYRESCQNDPSDILAAMVPEKRLLNGVVRISVKRLKALGFSVLPNKDHTFGIAGHVVIPELKSKDYPSKKKSFGPNILELCREASAPNNILIRPDSP